MKPPLPILLVSLALLTGGVFLGRTLHATSSTAAGTHTTAERDNHPSSPISHDVPPRVKPDAPAKGPKGTTHNLAGLAARFDWRHPEDHTLRREMARMSPEELKALAAAQAALLDCDELGKEGNARSAIIRIALEELYAREGLAVAAEWAISQEDTRLRRHAINGVLTRAMAEQPDAVMPWLARFKPDYGDPFSPSFSPAPSLSHAALTGALERGGVEELTRVSALLSEHGLPTDLYDLEFPPDTDFTKLNASLLDRQSLGRVIDQWAARDREAAWQAIRNSMAKDDGNAALALISLLRGTTTAGEEKEAAAWTMGKLAEFPPEQRSNYLVNVAGLGLLTEEGMAAAAAALEPQDRITLAHASFSYSRPTAQMFAVLESLPREDLLGVMRSAAEKNKSLFSPSSRDGDADRLALRRLYQNVAAHFSLTPEEMQDMLPPP